jgi:hypothetical protein
MFRGKFFYPASPHQIFIYHLIKFNPAELVEDGFFRWVEWGRLFQLGWLGTAFSDGLNGDGLFSWVGWGRLFRLSWLGTAFSSVSPFGRELLDQQAYLLPTISYQLFPPLASFTFIYKYVKPTDFAPCHVVNTQRLDADIQYIQIVQHSNTSDLNPPPRAGGYHALSIHRFSSVE